MAELLNAVRKKDIDRLRWLIAQGADVNEQVRGNSLLYYIIRSSNVKQKILVCKILLEAGADVNYQDEDERSLLYFAVFKNDVEMVKLLISYGANLDSLAFNGTPALIAAYASRRTDVFKLLLDSGANPNIVGASGRTILHNATEAGRIEIIELLLEAGADVDVVDRHGRKPLDLTDDEDIKDLFESYLYNIKEPYF